MKLLSCSVLADELEAAVKVTPAAPVEPPIAEGAPVDRLRAYAAHDPGATRALEDLLLEEDPGSVSSLERIRRLIRLTEIRMLNAKPERYGPLAGVLEKLIARERMLLPAPPPPPNALLEELLRLDEEAREMIEQHAPDPITAKEIQ